MCDSVEVCVIVWRCMCVIVCRCVPCKYMYMYMYTLIWTLLGQKKVLISKVS